MVRLKSLLRSLTLSSVVAGVILCGWSFAAAFIIISDVQGPNAGDNFGRAVSCRGGSVLVGAPSATFNGITGTGQAYIINSGTGVTAPLIYPPVPTSGAGINGAAMGTSVTYLDDVNSDFIPELAVGLPGYGSAGAVAIYYDPLSAPSVFLNGLNFGERFGTVITGITGTMSVNVPTLLVGAPQDSNNGGRVDVFDGINNFPIVSIFPPVNDGAAGFGSAIADAGDIAGNGLRSVAIAARLPASRAVYLYTYLTPSFLSFLRINDTSGNLFGASIADVGDVNADGVDDLLIGSPSINGVGHALLYSGTSLKAGTPAVLCDISGSGTGDGFGSAVGAVGVGATNGDYEFMVSAPQYGGGAGAVYGYGFQGGTCVLIDQMTGISAGVGLGVSLSSNLGGGSCLFSSGEFNDMAIGTLSNLNGVNAGSVKLVHTVIVTPTPSSTPIPRVSPSSTPSSTPTPITPPPTSARLSFRLDRNGNFSLRSSFSGIPPTDCELILFEREVVNGQKSPVHEVIRVKAPSKAMTFTLSGLPTVRIENDAVPEVHMISVLACNSVVLAAGATKPSNAVLQSNVFARYLNCGLGTGVSSATWSKQFRAKFRKKYQ